MSSLRTDELEYALPERLIATRPAEPRDAARMLVYRRGGEEVGHRHVRDLPEYLRAGDRLVFNASAVAPARLLGRRQDSGGRVEGLYLEDRGDGRWLLMLRSNGRLRAGLRVALEGPGGRPSGHAFELEAREGAEWVVRLLEAAGTDEILDAAGHTPLPPYILHARGAATIDDALDRAWYQTVYAERGERRSVAAPTAGLHFTPGLLEQIAGLGAERLDVVLHVGPGTFKPVTAETLAGHRMHVEHFTVPARTLAALDRHRADRRAGAAGRLIAVGTTSVRTLESLPAPLPALDRAYHGATDLLIAPPWEFRLVEGMLTNFHLPRSTLLALVAAMVGLERLRALYGEAIDRGYRFYSYGDAMLILP